MVYLKNDILFAYQKRSDIRVALMPLICEIIWLSKKLILRPQVTLILQF